MLHFAAPLWLFVLAALPGLWLAHALYGLPGVPAGLGRGRGARARRPLAAVISALAWLLLAAWAVSPTWRGRSETWHPAAVLLVVDESPRYAALGARDSSRRTVEAARAHYEARGFKVVETSLASLRDRRTRETSAAGAVPNLQAVLLWSDGRTPVDSLPRFSARVFPVVPELATREVQGESAFVADEDAADDEDGGGGAIQRVVVRWRALGQRVDARAEVVVGGRTVWSGPLPHPQGVEPGAEVTTRIAVPARPGFSREENVRARVLVRPTRAEDNTFVRNDTLTLHDADATRVTQVLVRPLATLDERALVDALRADRVFRVRVADPREAGGAGESSSAANAGAGRVTWLRAGRTYGEIRGEKRGEVDGPLVIYHPVSQSTADGRVFGPDARIMLASGGEAFLPAAVVRLADLGVRDGSDGTEAGGLVLRAPRAGAEPMAWAEEEGRRGLLVWREKATGTIGVALPSLWNARFRPQGNSLGTSRGVPPALAPVWLRGVALWSLSLHRAARTDAHGGANVADVASKGPPSDDLARIGHDREALTQLAARHDGTVLRAERALPEWPNLPDGQIREQATRTVNLTPSAITALVLAVLFSGIWLWRKRAHLD